MPRADRTITKTDSRTDTEHKTSNAPELHKHLKSLVLGYNVEPPREKSRSPCLVVRIISQQNILSKSSG